MADRIGISERDILEATANMRAFGEIMNVPPPQLDPIIQKFEDALRGPPGNIPTP